MPRSVPEWSTEAKLQGHKSAKEWLAKLYEADGLNEAQIAEKLGLSRSGAFHLLKRFGVKKRSKGGPNRR